LTAEVISTLPITGYHEAQRNGSPVHWLVMKSAL
jgi:hypothetical protein